MRCKNCKYWDMDNIIKEGTTSYSENIGGMAACKNKELDDSSDAKIISSEDAPTQSFITSPNFGCIHFESKQISDLEYKISILESRIDIIKNPHAE